MTHNATTKWSTRCGFRVLLMLGLMMCTVESQAQSSRDSILKPSVTQSIIFKDAPAVVMPSDVQTPVEGADEQLVYADVILRGVIGQVPQGRGECVLQDGARSTAVQYVNGLPVALRQEQQDVEQMSLALQWNPERVLLERVRQVTPQRNAKSPSDAAPEDWRLTQVEWDNWGRPASIRTLDANNEAIHTVCEWRSRWRGTCHDHAHGSADVQLSPQGEVLSVTWTKNDQDNAYMSIHARWKEHRLEQIETKGGTQPRVERYGYDTQGRLNKIERKTKTTRGDQVLKWRLHRDGRGNVDRIERRCSGACSGIRSDKTVTISYADTLQNTMCGVWWDDGLSPQLNFSWSF